MSILFGRNENNRIETLNRIRKTVIACFEEFDHKPSYDFADNSDFFEDSKNGCLDYLSLLMKIKKAFGFTINDTFIAGETTVGGLCSGILKAQDSEELEKTMGRFVPEGIIVISSKKRIRIEPFRFSRSVKMTVDQKDYHFIAEAKRKLDRDKIVVLNPKTMEEFACVVYLSIQANLPIVPYGYEPVDVRAFYDSSFNEKMNLKNLAECFMGFVEK